MVRVQKIKFWFIFILFFLLSFKFINFSFEHQAYTKEESKLSVEIKEFLEHQVNEYQLVVQPPYLWAEEGIKYSVIFQDTDSFQKMKKNEIDLYLNELSRITGLNLEEVDVSEANVRFVFSDDWRKNLLTNYPEFKNSRELTRDMSKEEYKKYWMTNNQEHYVFRGWNPKLKQLDSATLFFNNQIKNGRCQISVNTVRILMLPPSQMKTYTNSCRSGQLPLLEEAFLKSYYSDRYRRFLKNQIKPERKDIIKFFLDDMQAYIRNSSKKQMIF